MVDTHCHIHSADYPLAPNEVIARAHLAGVSRLLCVGTDADDSRSAVKFAATHDNTWAAIGLHPHDAKLGQPSFDVLTELASGYPDKIVAVGECGLDYFYGHSSKEDQEKALRFQIELAISYNLPLIFHVRDAFDDFWPIFDSYKGLRGVLHSFTDSAENAAEAIEKGLYIGVNGIMTFTKNDWQKELVKSLPLDKIVLETDAPFLTPVPKRGTINEPANVLLVAKFLSELRGESLEAITKATTDNAVALFSL